MSDSFRKTINKLFRTNSEKKIGSEKDFSLLVRTGSTANYFKRPCYSKNNIAIIKNVMYKLKEQNPEIFKEIYIVVNKSITSNKIKSNYFAEVHSLNNIMLIITEPLNCNRSKDYQNAVLYIELKKHLTILKPIMKINHNEIIYDDSKPNIKLSAYDNHFLLQDLHHTIVNYDDVDSVDIIYMLDFNIVKELTKKIKPDIKVWK